MSMIQHYKQISPKKLLEIDNDTSTIPSILNDTEYPELNIDKSWDGIHFLLTGELATSDKFNPENPINWVIVGWGEIGPDVGYGQARFVAPKEVTQLGELLANLKDEELKNRFNSEKMNHLGVYPDGVWDGEEVLDWLMGYYHQVKFL